MQWEAWTRLEIGKSDTRERWKQRNSWKEAPVELKGRSKYSTEAVSQWFKAIYNIVTYRDFHTRFSHGIFSLGRIQIIKLIIKSDFNYPEKSVMYMQEPRNCSSYRTKWCKCKCRARFWKLTDSVYLIRSFWTSLQQMPLTLNWLGSVHELGEFLESVSFCLPRVSQKRKELLEAQSKFFACWEQLIDNRQSACTGLKKTNRKQADRNYFISWLFLR